MLGTRTRATVTMVVLTIGVCLPIVTAANPAGAVTGPNLVHQASFEVPIPHAEPFSVRAYPPGHHIGAWRVSDAAVAVSSPFPPIVTGVGGKNQQFLVLKDPTQPPGLNAGTVCEKVRSTAASAYVLSFSSAVFNAAETVDVSWNGAVVAQVDDPVSRLPNPTTWTRHRVKLGAGVASGKLCFASPDGGEGYPFLDLVVVKAAGH